MTIVDITQTFDCTDAGLTINPGVTGQTVTGSVANGVLVGSFNPSTYQSGNQSYSIDITAPANDANGNPYSNAGVNISCSANAAGTNPTFALTNNGPVNEGQNITWTLTTANVANGTVVPFTLSGTASSPQDYSNVQPFQFTVQNNTATYIVTTFADNLTELGAETVIVTLAANDSAGNATGELISSATINDTSLTPTYSTITAQTVNEGQNMTFTLSTANVANGTTVNFAFSGTATQGTDYTVPGALQMTINNNSATYTIATTADQITDGNETVIMTLNATDSGGFGTGSITGTGTITDTSQAPIFDCVDAGLSIPNGTVGDPVTGTVTNGVIASINPATYQTGTAVTYTAQITAPPTDGNGVAYGNAGQNIPCTDTANGTAPAGQVYWYHLGTGVGANDYPFAANLITGTLYLADNTVAANYSESFSDMLANPSSYQTVNNQSGISDGDQFVFGTSNSSNFFWIAIADSLGVPDLTLNARLADTNNNISDVAQAKLAFTHNGLAYTLYQVNLGSTASGVTIQYNV